MVKIGNFEIEYDRNAPERVAVKIETDKNGEVWLSKCDIARAYDVFVQSPDMTDMRVGAVFFCRRLSRHVFI